MLQAPFEPKFMRCRWLLHLQRLPSQLIFEDLLFHGNRHILEFIKSTDVSLSNPESNNLFNNFIAILLLCLALGPDPIPSLIASNLFPSSNFTLRFESPLITLSCFVVFEIPIWIEYLSALTYFNLQVFSPFILLQFSLHKLIFSFNCLFNIFSILSHLHSSILFDAHTSVYRSISVFPSFLSP